MDQRRARPRRREAGPIRVRGAATADAAEAIELADALGQLAVSGFACACAARVTQRAAIGPRARTTPTELEHQPTGPAHTPTRARALWGEDGNDLLMGGDAYGDRLDGGPNNDGLYSHDGFHGDHLFGGSGFDDATADENDSLDSIEVKIGMRRPTGGRGGLRAWPLMNAPLSSRTTAPRRRRRPCGSRRRCSQVVRWSS